MDDLREIHSRLLSVYARGSGLASGDAHDLDEAEFLLRSVLHRLGVEVPPRIDNLSVRGTKR